ncbi:hypothetical protein LAZ67_3006129 [Cordylochernes scorpioides]|uniref:Mos1 transposase HTH domain-containing protein n=1 Tax=Cordylochernes scorpioides TaxID=51811 RepID=A0ABY6KCS2_9ARAC|nr:hypothetical protein LAZ67_3006129 [Cordylochernes scorpioides]
MAIFEEQRICIKFCFKLKKSATETYELIEEAFGDAALSLTGLSVYLGIMRCLREAVRLKRPERWQNNDWILHVGNARPHTVHVVLQFLAKHSTIQIPHPPYSPDLAPNDFFLYPKLKINLKGRKFDNVDMIQAESKATLRNLSKSDFISCFDNWKKRWNGLIPTCCNPDSCPHIPAGYPESKLLLLLIILIYCLIPTCRNPGSCPYISEGYSEQAITISSNCLDLLSDPCLLKAPNSALMYMEYPDQTIGLIMKNLSCSSLPHWMNQRLNQATEKFESKFTNLLQRCRETPEALHWTRQQQQKIDMDPEQQIYTPKIEDITTAVVEMYGDI